MWTFGGVTKRALITLWILWRFLALVFFVEWRARGWIVGL